MLHDVGEATAAPYPFLYLRLLGQLYGQHSIVPAPCGCVSDRSQLVANEYTAIVIGATELSPSPAESQSSCRVRAGG